MSTILKNSLEEYGNINVRTFLSAGNGYIKLTVSYEHCVSSKTAVYKKSLKEFKQMTDAEALTWKGRCVLSLLRK